MNIAQRFLFLFLSFISTNQILAQADCECPEELRRRPRIIQFFNAGKVDSAVLEFRKIRQVGTPECRISYNNSMAQYHINKNEIHEVPALMREEKRLLDSIPCSSKAYGRFYGTYGMYFMNLNQYQDAAAYFLEALHYAEKSDYIFGQQRALTNLSVVFAQMQQFDKCIFYQKKAETLARSIKNWDELGTILARQATTYNNLFQKTKARNYLDSAQFAARKSLRLAKENKNQHTLMDAYVALAQGSFHSYRLNQAILYADSALQMLPSDMHHMYKYKALRIKSQVYLRQGKHSLAGIYADSALAEARLFNPQMELGALTQVYEAQKSAKNFEKALWAYERMNVLQDSLADLEKFQTINELEQRFQKVKNEKNIQELTQTRKIALLRNQQLGLSFAIAILVIIALAFLMHQRTLRAKQSNLEKEQRLNRARMNPHFFFNALAALQVMATRTNDGRSIALYLSKFAAIMRQILESTYSEEVSLAQEKAFLEKYLELQSLRFPATFDYTISAEEGIDLERFQVPPLLIQPLAENAIEHGFRQQDQQNQLQIRFRTANSKQLLLEVEDNGQGLVQQTTHKKEYLSRASQIIQDTLSILRQRHHCDAHFSLMNKPEGGVLAQIYLPIIIKSR